MNVSNIHYDEIKHMICVMNLLHHTSYTYQHRAMLKQLGEMLMSAPL